MKKYYVYILRCRGNKLYVGFTSNLRKRVDNHQSGNGCIFTKNRRPIKLVYFEIFDEFMRAKSRENQIKGWRRVKKENLIKYGRPVI
ncbi:GIY-YIG nuclease family protein [Patescibacteria group bacterium]